MNMRSNMKIFNYIFSAMAAIVLAVSCSGTVDDTALPVLMVSDSEIDLATETSATFTVTYNGVDVTSEAEIYSTLSSLELQGNVFMPEKIGTASFGARYNGKESEPVTVTVIDTTPVEVESKYDRNVCVVEMTGAWCINCPRGYQLMYEKMSLPSNKSIKDKIHICAFHSDLEGEDTLAIAATQDIAKKYKLLAYPSFLTDFRTPGVLDESGANDFIPSIKQSIEDYPAHCGVAVSSSLNPDKTKSEITVKLASEKTSEYRVLVLVVQSKIIGKQKAPLYPDGQSDYIHNHVVRKVVTTYGNTFTGEKITDSAVVQSGEEVSKTWTVDIPKEWVLENTQIYAIALDAEGYANNMNVCAIDGGDSGYDLK